MTRTSDQTDDMSWLDLWRSTNRSDWFFEVFFDPMIECASSHIDVLSSEGGLCLDLGCGEGRKTHLLERCGINVVGIDINPAGLRWAGVTYHSRLFVLGDIHDLPFGDGTFDFVFSNSVLQCVDWRRVIRESRRVLKQNGRAIFIENLHGNPFARVYRTVCRYAGRKYPKYELPRARIQWGERGEFEEVFSTVEFDVFHLTTPVLLVLPALKNVLYGSELYVSCKALYRFLHRLDRWLLGTFPALANYGWITVVRAVK